MKKFLSLVLALVMTMSPVSYTHLDVYKRQREDWHWYRACKE